MLLGVTNIPLLIVHLDKRLRTTDFKKKKSQGIVFSG